MAAGGSTPFREALLSGVEVVDLTMLLNKQRWIFDEVHPQYTIGPVATTRRPREEDTELLLEGPSASPTSAPSSGHRRSMPASAPPTE
jgi:hypothetical protein